VTAAQGSAEPDKPAEAAPAGEALQHATQQVEQAVERAEEVQAEARNEADTEGAKGEAPGRKALGPMLRQGATPSSGTHGGASHDRGGNTVP
jgi:hypothetical protein